MARSISARRPEPSSVEDEVAQLHSLDLRGLQARWKIAFRRVAPPHLPKHLLFGVLAYRIQAEAVGDLDTTTRRLLELSHQPKSQSKIEDRINALDKHHAVVRAGTVLMREWKGRKHRVMVMAKGFAWNGKTYESLSAVAFAITRTRWNGPRFFGLRPSASLKIKSRANT